MPTCVQELRAFKHVYLHAGASGSQACLLACRSFRQSSMSTCMQELQAVKHVYLCAGAAGSQACLLACRSFRQSSMSTCVQELRAFKHAYLCAACPVLAAPDPPSPFSPSPASHPGSHQRSAGLRASCGGAVTPCSPHDSGLEEWEDLAFIPSESICTHLQRAFRLTDEKFCDYRYLINKTYVKKSALKVSFLFLFL